MITDKLILWWVSIVDSRSEDFENMTMPGWLDSASGYAGSAFGVADSMGAWVNFGLLSTVVASVLLSVVVGFGIKASRLGASAVTRRPL